MKNIVQAEREKAAETLPDMLVYLAGHPDRHTPFMDRWFRLCVQHGTQVYAASPEDAAPGRRLLYGTPARIVECIESAAIFGKLGVWFIKVVGDP